MTQQNTRTHAFDMNAISQSRKVNKIEQEEICIKVENLNLFYGEKQALHGITMKDSPQKSNRLYWHLAVVVNQLYCAVSIG